MKHYLLSLLCLSLLSFSAIGQNSWWQDASEPEREGRTLYPANYRTIQVDVDAIEQTLLSAPHENDQDVRTSPLTIEFPLPEGGSALFRYVYSPSVESKLSDQYPSLRTYAGQGVDDPSLNVRFNLTDLGFHAWIDRVGQSTVYIDPIVAFDREYCIAYTRADFLSSSQKGFSCHQESGDEGTPIKPEKKSTKFNNESGKNVLPMGSLPPGVEPEGGFLPAQAKSMALGERKDYVIAIAANGEYCSNFGGTVSGALAAIATTLNRVNGVYGRDFNVRLFLSGSNSNVIYTNSGTDPYPASNANWVNINQTTIDGQIGNGSYDIGHLFGGNGGGGYAPGRVCNNGNKAKAYTSLSNPQGDPFDIDYVCHEIGHQFSASHTFNSTCNGQRTSSTAVEPGNGSSIMAYAGVCGTQNYQANSDDVFHAVSIAQVDTYVTTGTGSNCESITNIINSAPTVVSTNFGGSFLPRSTPFFMNMIWNDPNGDPMTYTFDQTNTGPASSNQADLDFPSGNQPIFRPREDTNVAVRYFPEYNDVSSNTYEWDENIADYSRDLDFTAIARDNYSVGGNTGATTKGYEVVGSAGPFNVTSQSFDGLNYNIGSPISVSWSVNNTNLAPLNTTNVQIWTVADTPNGATNFVSVGNFANDGFTNVTLTEAHVGNNRRFWVQATNNVFYDVSLGTFDVVNPTDIAIDAIIAPTANQCGNQVQPQVELRNNGPLTITSATIQYFNDGGLVLTQPWAGSLAPGASIITSASSFYSFNTTLGAHNLTATVSSPNGVEPDANGGNDNQSISYTVGDNSVFVNVTTDRYGGETTWQITEDGTGTIVATGGPYATQAASGEYPQPAELVCLPEACYTLTVFDAFGDGICCGFGNGFVNITNAVGTVLGTTPASNWGSQVNIAFCVDSGCLDSGACNYDSAATIPAFCDYSCIGCTDSSAYNWDPDHTIDDGSCDYSCDEISVRFDLLTDCFPAETGWAIANEGDLDFLFVPSGTYTEPSQGYSTQLCLQEGCYDFWVFDSFGDGLAGTESGCDNDGHFVLEDEDGIVLLEIDTSNPNFGSQASFTFCVTKGCFQGDACNYDPTVNANDPDACDYSCYGCTDDSAYNWDPTATLDDGSCEFTCDDTPVAVAFTTDCFTENEWVLTDIFSGDTIQHLTDINLNTPDFNYYTNLCLAESCYNLQVLDGFGDGMTCGANGAFGVFGIGTSDVFVDGDVDFGSEANYTFCIELGCTDPTACNYYSGATVDDGSCDFISCVGCTDPLADNFSPSATQDNGSCVSTCIGTEVTFNLTSDCYEGETSWTVYDDGGNEVVVYPNGYLDDQTFHPLQFCLPGGCYELILFDGFGDGLAGIASGCTQDGDAVLVVDGVVVFDLADPNFGSSVTIPFCIESVGGCLGDINNDGDINTADLVILLGSFGCTTCPDADITGDGEVNTADLVILLGLFGGSCD